jgi:hypothetical protein
LPFAKTDIVLDKLPLKSRGIFLVPITMVAIKAKSP